jgi:GLPGLI family protein
VAGTPGTDAGAAEKRAANEEITIINRVKNRRSTIPVISTFWVLMTLSVSAQKKVGEFTLVYDYFVSTAVNAVKQPDSGQMAVHTVYIKGNKSRSEMANSLFSSATIYDGNTGTGVILRQVSGQKLLIRLTAENWQERSGLYEGIVFKDTTGTKEIAGYSCVQAVAQTRSGATITVYYTRDIIPENKEYDPYFKNLDGLPLEYELTNRGMTIKYKVSRINFNPVPASQFDIPKGGYREMNYEEGKKLNLGG